MRRLFLLLAAVASFIPSPSPPRATVIPCGTQARVTYLINKAPADVQTYRVSFRVQGVGQGYFYQTPVFKWRIDDVNSPTKPVEFIYEWTVERYPGRPIELFLDGLAAPCKQYPDGLTVTDALIQPVVVRAK